MSRLQGSTNVSTPKTESNRTRSQARADTRVRPYDLYQLATVIPFMSRLSGSTRVSTPTDSNRTRSPRQGISPKTVSVASVATNTLPLTTSGMANFAATASVSRVPAWLLLYSSVARFDAS